MDTVFATAAAGKAYVFRHNFSGNKWENVTNRKDGTSVVTFRKRGDEFRVRIIPEGGEKEDYKLARNAQIRDSGDGFIQVPLPDKKQLIGIKFKQKEEGPIFLSKIRAEMDINTHATMDAVVFGREITNAPGSEQLPKPMQHFATMQPAAARPHSPPLPSRPPKPAPPQEVYSNLPPMTLDNQPQYPPQPVAMGNQPPQPRLLTNDNYQAGQPVRRQQVNDQYNAGQPAFNAGQPAFNAGPQTNAQQGYGAGVGVPGMDVQRGGVAGVGVAGVGVANMQGMVGPGGQYRAPANAARTGVPDFRAAAKPPPNPPAPDVPSFSDVPETDHALFLANAINSSRFEAAHRMIDMLEKMSISKPNKKQLVISYGEDPPTPGEGDAKITLHLMIEFQHQNKAAMEIFLPFKASQTVSDLQQEVELNYHIPKATQNWIIGNKLVKGDDLKKRLSEFTIDGDGTTAKVFLYVMHTKKAKVPKEEYEAIRQCQQEERERKKRGTQPPWKKAAQHEADMDAQGRYEPPQAGPTHIPMESHPMQKQNRAHFNPVNQPMVNTLQEAGQDYMQRPPSQPLQAWSPASQQEEDHYSRTNHGYGNLAHGGPPAQRQADIDPTYERLGQHQRHPGEDYAQRGHHQQPVKANYPVPGSQQQPPGNYPVPGSQQQPPANYPVPGSQQQPPANYPVPGSQQQPPANYPVPGSQQQPPANYPVPGIQQQPHGDYPAMGNPMGMMPQTRQPAMGYPRDQFSQPPQLPPHPNPHQAPPLQPKLHQPPPPQPKPQPPPLPPPPPEPVGWTCPQCTYINKPRRPGCEICTCDRPADYKVPDDIPLDADEARILQGLQRSDQMFQEYTEDEKVQREREREQNFQALMQAEEEALITNEDEFECPICFVPIDPGEGVRLRGCLHQFCKLCLNQSIMISPDAEVKCPFKDDDYQCEVALPEREIKQLVTPEQLQKLYRRGLREAESAAGNSYHCKSTNCEGFCFYEDEVNEFHCPICTKVNCLTCKAIHEGINCQEYQDDLRRRAANDEAAKATQEMLDKLVADGDAMTCPKCLIVVQKKDGCDWIRCSVCKTEICWATKQARWGPKGKGDTSEGCHCRENGKKCHPLCRNCH